MTDLNNIILSEKRETIEEKEGASKKPGVLDSSNPETFYSWVESEHPYKPAVIAHYK